MPHTRERHILNSLLKRLKHSPIVAIQGARQTGKSVLAKDIITSVLKKSVYTTLDSASTRSFAESNPESFLSRYQGATPLIIDEAQKAPSIFDATKYFVDQDRKPGMYLLLGSTEFSLLSKIRESLTGRLSRIRMYPMILSETLSKEMTTSKNSFFLTESPRFSRANLQRYLQRGGFPAIFSIRSEVETSRALEDWLALCCQRDLFQFPKIKPDSKLAESILKLVATLEEPTVAEISSKTRVDSRKIKSHLNFLKELFVLQELSPHPVGTGKPRYYLCDVGLATFLGASFQRQLETYVLLSISALRSYTEQSNSGIYYYRTTKGSLVHLVLDEIKQGKRAVSALKITDRESLDNRDFAVMTALRDKLGTPTNLFLLGGGRFSLQNEKIEIYPWEAVG